MKLDQDPEAMILMHLAYGISMASSHDIMQAASEKAKRIYRGLEILVIL